MQINFIEEYSETMVKVNGTSLVPLSDQRVQKFLETNELEKEFSQYDFSTISNFEKQLDGSYLLDDVQCYEGDTLYRLGIAWTESGPGRLLTGATDSEILAYQSKQAAKAQARHLINLGKDTLELAVSLLMQYAPVSDEQADLNSAALEPIQLLLTNGSLDKALTKVSALDVSTLSYSEADKQEIVDDLTEKLLSLS